VEELKKEENNIERALTELEQKEKEAELRGEEKNKKHMTATEMKRNQLEEEERQREVAEYEKKTRKQLANGDKPGKHGKTTKKARGGIQGHMGHMANYISFGIGLCCDLKEPPGGTDYRKKVMKKPQLNKINYDFIDYAPRVFRDIRGCYGISQQAFVDSIVKNGIAGGDTGAGKSGMLFFFFK